MDVTINAKVVNESGYEAAMLGLSFNKKRSSDEMHAAALKLCKHDGGHNKFLESMIIHVEVQAPRFWWQEGDTYRMATKQSESTMHTLVKELQALDPADLDEYIQENFDGGFCLDQVIIEMMKVLQDPIYDEREGLVMVKRMMPEGFLQKRMWCISYKTFRNMYLQRKNHRLPHWPQFLALVVEQLKYPELLGIEEDTFCGSCALGDECKSMKTGRCKRYTTEK